jgi:hypothetical protein
MQPAKSHHYTKLCLDLAFIVADKISSNTKASTRCQCFFCRFPPRQRLASGGLGGVDWLSLCDSLSTVKEKPPWVLHEGLAQASLLNGVLGPKAYLAAPGKHLSRLWMRFQEGH